MQHQSESAAAGDPQQQQQDELDQVSLLRSSDVIDGSDNSGVARSDELDDAGSSIDVDDDDDQGSYTASQDDEDEERGIKHGTQAATAAAAAESAAGTMSNAAAAAPYAPFGTRAASAGPGPGPAAPGAASVDLASRRSSSRRRRRAASAARHLHQASGAYNSSSGYYNDGGGGGGGLGGGDASSRILDAKALALARAEDSCGCCVAYLGQGSAVLWLFTLCQLLIFYDRGMVAGFLPAIQRDLGGVSDTSMGLMGSGFIFGYMLACPLFAFFSKTYSPYKLMAVGLFLWVQAVLLCGLTDNFITLLGARILTGVGEASFAGLAPTCIDDVAPLRHRTIWLSFFFAGVPIGSALGYIAGGWFSAAGGPGWHLGFLLEAAAMVPVMIIVFLWPYEHPDAPQPLSQAEDNAEAIAYEEEIAAQQANNYANAALAAGAGGADAVPTTAATTTGKEGRRTGGSRKSGPSKSRRPRSRAEAVAPVIVPAETNTTAGRASTGGDADEDEQQPSPVGALPLAHASRILPSSSFISRSISTPALKRLDDVPFEAQHRAYQQDQQQQQQPQPAVDAQHTSVHAVSDSAPPLATGSAHPSLTLSIPPSPTAAGGSRGSFRSFPRTGGGGPSAARTPALREQAHSYIVPADPMNPFHAPGQHYRPGSYAVATPAHQRQQRQRKRQLYQGGVGGPSDDDDDEELMGLDPTASFPSPGSFNPHYAAQQLESLENADGMFVTDVVTLLTDGVYIVVVLGYAALAFVIGALSFWAPVDFSATLHISIARSTQIIGVITFTCGLGGTFFGGWCLDARGSGKGIFAVTRALELCVLFVSVSIVFALGAVLTLDLTTSMVCLAVADFFLFATGAPVNAALLSVAPKNMRSLAMAMSILLMHALGDLPSPFLMGYITDLVNSIRLALVILILWLLWTVAFWVAGVALARRRGQEFKQAMATNMARPAHERAALLARRGSTGQFYAPADPRASSSFSSNASRGTRGGLSYQSSGGGGGSGGGYSSGHGGTRSRDSSAHQQQPQGQQQQYSRPITPARARSTATTPQQQYRRTGYVPAGSAAAAGVYGSFDESTHQHHQQQQQLHQSPSHAMLPIFDPSGSVVGYAQQPTSQSSLPSAGSVSPHVTVEQQHAALAFSAMGTPLSANGHSRHLSRGPSQQRLNADTAAEFKHALA
jgi:MFS family permease